MILRTNHALKALILLVIVLLPKGLSAQTSDSYQQKIDAIAKQINQVTNNLNQDKAKLNKERSALLKEEKRIASLNLELAQLDQTIELKTRELGDLTQQAESVKKSSAADRKELMALIRHRYMQGNSNYLKMLLDQENPYAVGRLQNYYDFFHAAQKKKLGVLQAQATELASLQKILAEQQARLIENKQSQTAKKQTLDQSKKTRAKNVASLSDKVKQSSEKLTILKADRQRLSSLLQKLAAQTEKLKRLEEEKRKQAEVSRDSPLKNIIKGGFLKQKGRLTVPVKGRLKYQYGNRLKESGMRAEGVFFNTEQARPVHSIFAGQVLFADFLKGYGLLIIIDHGDQHISLYGHNELLYKKVGDMVDTDEVISKSGITGGLREPGLYFEIRKNATPVDPAKWCQF